MIFGYWATIELCVVMQTDINIWEDLKIENGIVCFTSPPYNLGNSIQLSGNKYLNKKNHLMENIKIMLMMMIILI